MKDLRFTIVSKATALAMLLFAPMSPAHAQEPSNAGLLQWSELPPLPDSIGMAGPFAGVSDGALIVAGGANFPDGRPWEGHSKVWHDRVFILDEPEGSWVVAPTRLPRPAAYGVALTWRDSVVCIGGGNSSEHFNTCYVLERRGQDVAIEPLPSLPIPVAFASGAIIDDVVYVLGGIDEPNATTCLHRAFALDLSVATDERSWVDIEPWPGPERYLSVAGVQNGHLYLFGGIRLSEGSDGLPTRIKPFLKDAYRLTPGPGTGGDTWTPICDLPHPIAAAPSPASALGSSHLLVFGGDDGLLAGGTLQDAHPGFSAEILGYHTVTNTWISLGTMPADTGPDPASNPGAGTWPPVTTTTVLWHNRIVIPTGEVRPGVRTPRVLAANPVQSKPNFGVINYAVIIVYLGALILMGVYFSKREKTTGDFFIGGRRVPWWAAGISIFGTQLSAITFLAIPAKTYATDWLYFIQNMGIIAIAPLIVWMYIPFFRRLNIISAYEYLEHRFNLAVRLFGAFSFIAFQLARMGIVMFLPALALAAVTGMDITMCIVIMGVLCTIYTVLGGIEAVIWTDVLQVFVLLGGAVVALIVILLDVDGGARGVLEVAVEQDKLRLAQFSWDWTGPAIGVILLGAVFNNLVPYSSDQAVVQRYLTTPDEKRAARAVWTGALLSVPASIMFFSVGTALFVFYQQHPERLNPLGPPDQIFAWFIVQELPAGVAGLVIAGVFAAAMSSLDSSMNSISAVVTTDLIKRLSRRRDDRTYLAIARWITVVLGVAGTATAVILAQFEVQSLWDQFLSYIGLLGGTMAGLFALGIVSTRANSTGAVVGAAAAVGVLVFVKTSTDFSGLLYAALGMVTCIIVGYIVSVTVPGPRKPIEGLTIHTVKRGGGIA